MYKRIVYTLSLGSLITFSAVNAGNKLYIEARKQAEDSCQDAAWDEYLDCVDYWAEKFYEEKLKQAKEKANG